MKFETDDAKRQARVAHRERMKQLDKAQARADKAYNERYPERKQEREAQESQEERVARIRAEYRREQERLEEAEFERHWQPFFVQSKNTIAIIVGVLGLGITATYYAWIAMAWYEAPAYMAFGWGLEKLRQKLKKK